MNTAKCVNKHSFVNTCTTATWAAVKMQLPWSYNNPMWPRQGPLHTERYHKERVDTSLKKERSIDMRFIKFQSEALKSKSVLCRSFLPTPVANMFTYKFNLPVLHWDIRQFNMFFHPGLLLPKNKRQPISSTERDFSGTIFYFE